jgi:Transcriptional regulator
MDRQAQFRAREALIFQVAEQLLLENGEAGMTLDALAAELDLAKGTLYKHFKVKMNYICCSLFVMNACYWK